MALDDVSLLISIVILINFITIFEECRFIAAIIPAIGILQVAAISYMSDVSIDESDKSKNFGTLSYCYCYVMLMTLL